MKSFIFIILSIITLTSCEKVITLELNQEEPKLVIDAVITNQPGPYFVTITKSNQFTDPNNYPAVNDATVTITDNASNSEVLLPVGNGKYRTNTLQGTPGRTYTLTVIHNSKQYTAISTMPAAVSLLNLRSIKLNFGNTTVYRIVPEYNDPTGLGNNYRLTQTVNGVLDKTYVLFNDNVNNGLLNQRPIISNDIDLKAGDNVIVGLQCIDKNVYDYFFTLSNIDGNGPGGGTTPSNPPTNISGGALGVFSAHTIDQKSIVIL
jgi:hypothetical protein